MICNNSTNHEEIFRVDSYVSLLINQKLKILSVNNIGRHKATEAIVIFCKLSANQLNISLLNKL